MNRAKIVFVRLEEACFVERRRLSSSGEARFFKWRGVSRREEEARFFKWETRRGRYILRMYG